VEDMVQAESDEGEDERCDHQLEGTGQRLAEAVVELLPLLQVVRHRRLILTRLFTLVELVNVCTKLADPLAGRKSRGTLVGDPPVCASRVGAGDVERSVDTGPDDEEQ